MFFNSTFQTAFVLTAIGNTTEAINTLDSPVINISQKGLSNYRISDMIWNFLMRYIE